MGLMVKRGIGATNLHYKANTRQISTFQGYEWARPEAMWVRPDVQMEVDDVAEGGGQVRGGGGGGSGGKW